MRPRGEETLGGKGGRRWAAPNRSVTAEPLNNAVVGGGRSRNDVFTALIFSSLLLWVPHALGAVYVAYCCSFYMGAREVFLTTVMATSAASSGNKDSISSSGGGGLLQRGHANGTGIHLHPNGTARSASAPTFFSFAQFFPLLLRVLAFSVFAIGATFFLGVRLIRKKGSGEALILLSWLLGVLCGWGWLTSVHYTIFFEDDRMTRKLAPAGAAVTPMDAATLERFKHFYEVERRLPVPPQSMWIVISLLTGVFSGILCKIKDMQDKVLSRHRFLKARRRSAAAAAADPSAGHSDDDDDDDDDGDEESSKKKRRKKAKNSDEDEDEENNSDEESDSEESDEPIAAGNEGVHPRGSARDASSSSSPVAHRQHQAAAAASGSAMRGQVFDSSIISHKVGYVGLAERLYLIVPFSTGQWFSFVIKNGLKGVFIENGIIIMTLGVVGYAMLTYKFLKQQLRRQAALRIMKRRHQGADDVAEEEALVLDVIALISRIFTTSFGVVLLAVLLFSLILFLLVIPFVRVLFSLNALVSTAGILVELIFYDLA